MEMRWLLKAVFVLVILALLSNHKAVAETRTECVINIAAAAGGGVLGGDDDEFEFDDDMDEMGGFAAIAAASAAAGTAGVATGMGATGSLKCPVGNRGLILVKRVAYGASGFPGVCQSDGMCAEEFDTADKIANKCDGQSSCNVDMLQPVFLKCGRMSSYMLIEYECIDSLITFEVCETVSTVVHAASVFITSSGYLTSKPVSAAGGIRMCECIIQSQDKADLYLDYLQTQLASEGDLCPYEYAMIESKKNINQTTIDKELEVCGRRHVGNRWYQGSIRLTYASGGPMPKRGLLAKFTVDNRGTPPKIEIECGPLDASKLKLKDKPPPIAEGHSPSVTRTRVPGSSGSSWPLSPLSQFPPVIPPYMPPYMRGFGMGDDDDGAFNRFMFPHMNFPPLFPPQIRQPQPAAPPREVAGPSVRGPPTDRLLDFSNWKINLPSNTKSVANPVPAWSNSPASIVSQVSVPEQTRSSWHGQQQRLVPESANANNNPTVHNTAPPSGKNPSNSKPVTKNINDGDTTTKDGDATSNEGVPVIQENGKGRMVGVVFGGIGAFLILGSVCILAIHNYRKRQRIKREEAEYVYGRNINISGGSASPTYGKGWESNAMTDGEVSVYATVREVETCREQCVNPSVGNKQETSFVCPAVEDKFVGDETVVKQSYNDEDQTGTGKPNEGFVYAGPSCTAMPARTQEPSTRDIHVAVIDVHHTPYDCGEHLHNTDCLSEYGYSTVSKDDARAQRNGCSACNIVPPPRRRDTVKGYDNNISVKKHLK